MLRSFRFANHRSFRDEHELTLVPAYDKRRSVLPVAGIYGANAAGKSNVVDAMAFMQSAVVSSYSQWDADGGVPRSPFRLDKSSLGEPSWYVVDLTLDGVRYVYGFSVDDERIREEWLYSYPRGRKRVLFERDGDKFDFGPSLAGPKSTLEELVRPNSLFLSLAGRVKLPDLAPLEEWFRRSMRIWRGSDLAVMLPDIIQQIEQGSPNVEQIRRLIAAADVGITGVSVEWRPPHPNLLYDKTVREIQKVNVDLAHERTKLGELILFDPEEGPPDQLLHAVLTEEILEGRLQALEEQLVGHTASRPEIRLVHGDGGTLSLSEESKGTQIWLALIWRALEVLESGAILLVDELDSSLHPLLSAQLIGLFQDSETNPRGAQIIFTAHDTSLLGTALGREVLERDQVWFVQKEADGASKLFALSEFHPRKGENPERRYLAGAYGAIPNLSSTRFADALTDRGSERGAS